MSEMVERVALAIAETVAGPGAQPRGNWLVAARAAIAAMREPTQPMIFGSLKDKADWQNHVQTWRSMIDAALSEDVQA
jgi:hypothetical protein